MRKLRNQIFVNSVSLMRRNAVSIDSSNPEPLSPSAHISNDNIVPFRWQAETHPFSKMTFVQRFTVRNSIWLEEGRKETYREFGGQTHLRDQVRNETLQLLLTRLWISML
jgi:hypothetical protein